jgi:hypothetical protein
LKYLEDSYTVLFQAEQQKQDRDLARAAEMQAIQQLVALIRSAMRLYFKAKHLVQLPGVKLGLIAPPTPATEVVKGSSHVVR